MDVRLTESALLADREMSDFTAGLAGEGAVVSFVGIARDRSSAGASVVKLFLEHHPRLTQSSMTAIGEAARKRFEITALRIVHRHGAIAPGETIVLVAAASAHRRAAFEAAEYVMDRLKTDALFWKREDTNEGSRWIEPGETDYAARQRWSAHCPE